MSPTIASIGSVFDRAIVDTGRLSAFLFFVALLGTFGFIRMSTHMIRAQVSWWPGNVSVGGTHVHHLVWGICAMMITGYFGLVVQPDSPWQEIITVLFAIGMGLTLDEFALWVDLKDVYWEQEGRKSIDAMVIAGCIAGMVLVGLSAWADVADSVENEVVTVVGTYGILAVVVALVNASKEKFGMALIALLFWFVGMVPALRLAKPHSLWARVFYRGEKLERARRRYPVGIGAAPADPEGSPPADSSPNASTAAGQSSS